MGFARGLDAGSRMARGWIDTYNAAKNEGERRAINEAQATETTQFSDAQGLRLRQAAEAGDKVGYSDGLGYSITQHDPGEGMAGPSLTEFVAPQRTGFSLNGKQYDTPYTPDNVSYARRSALAEHAGIANPELGLRMQANADKLYEADQARTTQRQTEAIEAGATDFLKQYNTQDLVGMLAGVINPVDSGVPGMLMYDEKTGGATTMYRNGEKDFSATLTPAQVREYARQAYISGKGNLAAGVPIVVAALQGAQDADLKGRKTALEMDNLTGQIEDRKRGRDLQQARDDWTKTYQGGLLESQRAGHAIQAFNAGVNARSVDNRANPQAKHVTPKFDDVERDALDQFDKQIGQITRQEENGVIPRDQASAQIAALQQQRAQVVQGAVTRAQMSNAVNIIRQGLRDGGSLEDARQILLDSGRAPEFVDAVMRQVGAPAAPKVTNQPADAQRPGLNMPSQAPAAPAPAPKATTTAAPKPAAAPAATPKAAAPKPVPEPKAPPAPAPVSREQAVAKAFGVTGKGGVLDKTAGARAEAAIALHNQVRTEQSRMAAVARSGDPQAIARQMERIAAAGRQLDAALGQINDQQKKAIRRALEQ